MAQEHTYTVHSENDPQLTTEVEVGSVNHLPDAVLAFAKAHGAGNYVAKNTEGGKVLRLSLDWFER